MAIKEMVGQIYKCETCGNIVEIVHLGGGNLVCCGKPMVFLEEKTIKQELNEKHVPIIEKTKNGVKVKVGSIEHPMLPEHYIEFIEVITEKNIYRKFLKPGEKPEA